MKLSEICFFYRTKCNGFRIAFESASLISDADTYAKLCAAKEREIEECFLRGNDCCVDLCFDQSGQRGELYWSYPLVQNPVWLNPNRQIR